jgi:hypothetical protein
VRRRSPGPGTPGSNRKRLRMVLQSFILGVQAGSSLLEIHQVLSYGVVLWFPHRPAGPGDGRTGERASQPQALPYRPRHPVAFLAQDAFDAAVAAERGCSAVPVRYNASRGGPEANASERRGRFAAGAGPEADAEAAEGAAAAVASAGAAGGAAAAAESEANGPGGGEGQGRLEQVAGCSSSRSISCSCTSSSSRLGSRRAGRVAGAAGRANADVALAGGSGGSSTGLGLDEYRHLEVAGLRA